MEVMETITKEEVLAYLQDKKAEFFSKYQLEKLGLFGSYARNEASIESDIDLLVDFRPDTADLYEKKMEMKSFVESRFNRKVDICTEKYIKPYFKNQILRSVIYV